ncbi:MAG: hypothetical protein KGM24_04405 [Elusimicrobia bacterium]|nr:hypothetical protein [Elusimicrobiota bacterium]
MTALPLAFRVALAAAAARFPGLPKPELRAFRGGPATYFESQPRPGGRCVVFADPRAAALPSDALEAILAHELAHCESYRAMSLPALARLGLLYWLSPDGPRVAAYERAMDERVVALGLGPGLKAYRRWLYPRLTPARRALKRRLYLTPQEIDARIRADARRQEL